MMRAIECRVPSGRLRAVRWIVLSALSLAGMMLPAAADTWVLDRTAAQIRFQFDRYGLSRQSGTFRDVEVQLEFAPTDPESGKVAARIRAASIDTGLPDFDRLLRSPDFFDTARHPVIEFVSSGVSQTGDRSGRIAGQLTMLGQTHPVTLDVRWNYTGENPLSTINPVYQGKWVSGFSARTTLQRSLWGLKRGIPLVPDEVDVTIEVEFTRVD